MLVLVALAFGGAVTVLHEDSVSPIDELTYLDYADKVWDQGLVHKGEKYGEGVARLVACEQVIVFGRSNHGQVCGSDHVNVDAFPNQGYTTGDGYTPLYFWTVRIVGDPVHALTGLSEISSWRLSGVLWLAATVLVLSALMKGAGVSNLARLSLGLLFIASPYSWWTYTYVSTDASVVLLGAAVLLVGMNAVAGRWSAWWLVPLGLLAPLFKITNLLVFGLLLLYVLIDRLARWRRARKGDPDPIVERSVKGFWLPVVLAVALAGIVQAAWMRLVPLMAVSDVVVDQGVAVPLTASEIARQATNGITGAIMHNPYAGSAPSPLLGLVQLPLSWIVVGAVVGAVMSMPWNRERGPVVWATAIAAVLALPLLGVAMWLLAGVYFPLPGRYAAGILPAVLLVAGYMLRNRVAVALALIYAGVLLVSGIGFAIYIGAAY